MTCFSGGGLVGEAGMMRGRKIVLACLVAVAAVALLVPAGREELAWYWAQSQNRAADYMGYFTDWPKGRHVKEARVLYEQRLWEATKRGLILQAYQQTAHTNASPDADAAYRQERRKRHEVLFWRQATNANTITSYKDYLQQYPRGQFTVQARRQIARLTGAPSMTNAPPP
jgi:hypothetical protein